MRFAPRLAVPAATALALLLLTGCETTSRSTSAPRSEDASGPVSASGSWARLPDSPLSAREGPATAHVETADPDLVVVVGGYVGPPCPPGADCSVPEDSTASDGAAYDLDEDRWMPIVDAPRPVSSFARTAVGARDGSGRGWTRLDRPRGAPSQPGPGVWVRDTLLVVGGADWDDGGERRRSLPEEVRSTGVWAWRAH